MKNVLIIKKELFTDSCSFTLQDECDKCYNITNCHLTTLLTTKGSESYQGSYVDENGTNHIVYIIIDNNRGFAKLDIS